MKFYELVDRMRILQKEYFRSRTRSSLIECKKAESEVDKAIVAWKSRQPNLAGF